MKPYVISLGGSLIVPYSIDTQFLLQFKSFILRQVKKGRKFIIICGGGVTARTYITAGRNISKVAAKHYDEIGVKAAQLNATLVHTLFEGKVNEELYENYHRKKKFKHILLGSGFHPGTSTDYEAVQFAKLYNTGAVFNLTNVDYVYNKDPRKFSHAQSFTSLSWKQYLSLIGKKWDGGMHAPFDPLASREAQKHNLKVYILHGKKLNNVEQCFQGKSCKGTVIG